MWLRRPRLQHDLGFALPDPSTLSEDDRKALLAQTEQLYRRVGSVKLAARTVPAMSILASSAALLGEWKTGGVPINEVLSEIAAECLGLEADGGASGQG